jgi:adenosylmethionine-8-amino-7-oxononanoate aminotransferase
MTADRPLTVDPAKASGNDAGSGHLVPAMTQLASALAEPAVLAHGQGLRLWDTGGREYLDAFSGMMNVNLGYGREDMARCLADASRDLSFALSFFGYSHLPQAELAGDLAAVTPAGIERFFFTTGGSDAIDTAIKLARHYHRVRGRDHKTKILGRYQSYHGMTLAATRLSGSEVYWRNAEPLPPGVVHIPQPNADPEAGGGADPATALEAHIQQEGPESIAAFIAEPISLPTGAALPPADYWPNVRQICSAHDILLVSDEVITGFGRTGRMFAIEHWGVSPDLLVMAKGITAGYAPLGAVGLTSEVVDAIARSGDILAHGFTCGGHPISCAAARKNLEILARDGLVARTEELGRYLERRLRDRGDVVRDVPRLGLLFAVDADVGPVDLAPLPGPGSTGAALNQGLREEGLLARVYGSTIVMGPSFTITQAEADEIADRLGRALARATELRSA